MGGLLRRGDHRGAVSTRRLEALPREGATIPTAMSPWDGTTRPDPAHAGQQRLLLPHAVQRLAAIPVALAIAWLGYALLTERRARASEPATNTGSPQQRRIAAE
jgi:hypothetical protein